jgi:hypothetical protein
VAHYLPNHGIYRGVDRHRDGARLLETGTQFLITTPRLYCVLRRGVWRAELLTMTAITFTWANADFDRRHSTSEMGHFRPIDDVCVTSATVSIATKLLNYRNGRNGPSCDMRALFTPVARPAVRRCQSGSRSRPDLYAPEQIQRR